MEVGPYRVKDGAKPELEYNPGAWDEFANIIFVDNPVGTGFSYVNSNSYVHELPEMANQFIIFLEKFFALFPEYEHDDVSNLSSLFVAFTDAQVAVYCGRIICWTTYSVHHKGNS